MPQIPTCGYLLTHTQKKISFLHIGNPHEPYSALVRLAGCVDFLIHMKLGLSPWEAKRISDRLVVLVDLIQPEFLIPTHYQIDRISDPVPDGHWPPNATDTNALVESIREAIGDGTTVLPFTADIE